LESKNISINFLKVCFCSGGFAAPNRRLLERKILLDFQKPLDLIPAFKSSYKNAVFSQEGAKAPSCLLKNPPSQIWSQLLYAARTYFEKLVTEI
jgi:hypothetical protein